eukprot:Skav211984  [mRNA]  locus=scaffold2069:32386:33504:+ [translate_table: standard]
MPTGELQQGDGTGSSQSSGSESESGEEEERSCFCCWKGRNKVRSSEAGTASRSIRECLLETLHGVSQVCFFTNSIAGAVFLIAVLVGKPREAVLLGLIGVLAARGLSLCVGFDADARSDGTLGYNAMLVGCAFAFAMPTFWWAVVATPFAAGMSAFLAAGFLKILSPQFTLAFNFAALSVLVVVHLLNKNGASVRTTGVTFRSVLPEMSVLDCLVAILNGVSQIFFVTSPVSGFIILAGIALAGPVMALNTLLGSIVATLGAAAWGADIARLQEGIWGYNAALTSLWISFHFRLGYLPLILLVCFGAAGATVAFAAMDRLVAQTHGFIPFCFTLPFNAVGLLLVALQSFVGRIQSMVKANLPSAQSVADSDA